MRQHASTGLRINTARPPGPGSVTVSDASGAPPRRSTVRHRAVRALHADLERAARLADADLRDAVGKVRREHDGRGDAAGGAAVFRDAGRGLARTRPALCCHMRGRKKRPDGAGLGRGGDGPLHERHHPAARTVDDKVRDAGKRSRAQPAHPAQPAGCTDSGSSITVDAVPSAVSAMTGWTPSAR